MPLDPIVPLSVALAEPIRKWAAAVVLAASLALCGCGSEDERSATAPATRSPAQTSTPEQAASVPAGLSGSWERTTSARDWKLAGGGYPLGTWRFDVDAKGAVGVYYPRTDKVDFSTEFVVAGGRLTIESIPVCPGIRGRYTWRATARELTLTVADDDGCAPRPALFGGTWRRRR